MVGILNALGLVILVAVVLPSPWMAGILKSLIHGAAKAAVLPSP